MAYRYLQQPTADEEAKWTILKATGAHEVLVDWIQDGKQRHMFRLEDNFGNVLAARELIEIEKEAT